MIKNFNRFLYYEVYVNFLNLCNMEVITVIIKEDVYFVLFRIFEKKFRKIGIICVFDC